MKKIVLIVLSLLPAIAFSQTFSVTVNTAIPDYGTSQNATVPLVVSGLPTSIDASFGIGGTCFDITHTYDSDLDIRLQSPAGNIYLLAGGIGGSAHNFTGTCLAEDGVNGYIENAQAPFTGTYIPMSSLNQFNDGQNPNGTWNLIVTDYAGADTGSVHLFSITFMNNPPADPGPPPVLCNFCVCQDGSPNCDLLPDMTASALIIQNEQLETPGTFNISNATPNIGYGPLEIHGVDSCYCGTTLVPCSSSICPNGDPVKQRVHQRIYVRTNDSDTLTSYERPAGTMTYHPSHGHIHVDNWANYTIRRATPDPDATTWPILGTGTKQSFCLINLGNCTGDYGYCVDTSGNVVTMADIPNAGFGVYSGCGLDQGIYPGMLDIYTMGLNDPIDLTGICNGDYYLVSITDPDNNMLESNENNNWVAVPITLTQQTPSPNANFTTIQVSTQVALNAANLTNATSFEWDFGDGTFDNTNNPTIHNYTANGTYIITFTVNSPCGIFVHTDTVTITTVGIFENSVADEYFLTAQPNPAKGVSELSFFVIQNSAKVTIELYNAVGQKVSTLLDEVQLKGRHKLNIDFKNGNLNSGMYFVKMTSPDKNITIRLMNMD